MSAYGATVKDGKTNFRVRSPLASAMQLCLFENDQEQRIAMQRDGDDWVAEVPRDLAGATYGYRADGEWQPEQGRWFHPAKLLVDPYAVELDRRFVQDPALANFGVDTGDIVPRAIIPAPFPESAHTPPQFVRGGLIYELNVDGFTRLHPDVPDAQRGTISALAHPAIIAHLQKLQVSAVELMPITAWINERHLSPLGLANHWGYNPVGPMALDPGLCPGGVAELRETIAALHHAGIGVILDLVPNHSGESDIFGGVFCLRGLDDTAYAHGPDGTLINDSGCGNTLDFSQSHVRDMTVAALRHFVRHCGIDGFRFDLAPIMARGPSFDRNAPIFDEIAADPWLADRVMIAEPWDIGPGGYQLGNFPDNWLEWNDKYRDDVRRFWRGDGTASALATRMAGSADVFGNDCRSVNFLAAHDGFTLADGVAYEQRHNLANGEDNRDGHGENYSWNNGVEGPTDNPEILARRAADLRALLGTLFASTGTIMLTAGDEFGRSQQGNNNAYCQPMPVDWGQRDIALEDHVANLSAMRNANAGAMAQFPDGGWWADYHGNSMRDDQWNDVSLSAFAFHPPVQSARPGFAIDRIARTAVLIAQG
ncbi:MAG: glycogen debranching enzyme [Alteraurantiacibacter sp.]